jgi:hypothetical protein
VSAEQKDRLRFGDAPAHKLAGIVAEEGISVLKDLNYARKSIIEALSVAPAQDANARSALTGRMHENARIRGTITGELAKSPLVQQNTLNVFINSSEFVTFQAQLMDALAPFTLRGGMSKGLPLANLGQQGLIAQGIIWQAFGNWTGTNQTPELIMQGSANPDAPISFDWKRGTNLEPALKLAFAQALPKYK